MMVRSLSNLLMPSQPGKAWSTADMGTDLSPRMGTHGALSEATSRAISSATACVFPDGIRWQQRRKRVTEHNKKLSYESLGGRITFPGRPYPVVRKSCTTPSQGPSSVPSQVASPAASQTPPPAPSGDNQWRTKVLRYFNNIFTGPPAPCTSGSRG